jgi:phosphoribosylanthranilate isomerase
VAHRLFVKVCGITRVEDGVAAAEAGADAVGFVFWPGSPRRVDVERARRIGDALPGSVVRVGVFVNAGSEALARTAEQAGLDLLQLHGDEAPEALAGLPRPAWKALRVGPDFSLASALRYEGRAAGLLLDSHVAGRPGGSGQRFDWRHVALLRERVRFLILAGGLSPENVAEAVAMAQPDGVDVSSGVESAPGRKDPARLHAFIDAARKAGERPAQARGAAGGPW